MFLPPKHPAISEIEKIDIKTMMFKGESAPLYEYRNQVIEHINQSISDIDTELDKDMADLLKWFKYRCQARWWASAKKEKSPAEMAEWILENALKDLEEKSVNNSFRAAAGVSSESELEDALQWAESANLIGSKKQINWARSIATQNVNSLAEAQKLGKNLPTLAKWWIDNRNNIIEALKSLPCS